MSESGRKSKDINATAKSRIDSRTEFIEPIDFSFKDIISPEEIRDVQPRVQEKHTEPKKHDGKYVSLGLKLGYNALSELHGLYEWCTFAFAKPDEISSLDLSFNCFSNVPEELLMFKGLKTLYFHGNKINDLKEIDKLKNLKNLISLTVHGNPIENLNGFRYYILMKLPTLRHLNFSGISKADRQTAMVWVKSNNKSLKFESNDQKEKIKEKEIED